MKLSRPEILAPAGDHECMRAAVRAGADAVYFGLQGFNARARAQNFDAASLATTMRFLHAHGVLGYVTLNTLVFDHEFAMLEGAVRACAAAGVDAVIVQDLGVARLVREVAPTLAIHASTQMTCTDVGAVEFARSLGASRVILARELSLDDLTALRAQTSMELEVFVHGALCIAYSGQCLTSEAIGGRSANRGACAQACRLPYELLVDGVLRDLGERAYLLSPEDLDASSRIEALTALGITSFKIEGRLKGPAYVAATTRLYRAAVAAAMGEAPPPERTLHDAALQTFSRGSGVGFLDGVDHQRLVEARTCDHRGLAVGTAKGIRQRRGRTWITLSLDAALSRGDGILIEGGRAGNGELGGRVWSIEQGGAEVECATPGEAHLWLGPERTIGEVVSGRRVWRTSAPSVERAVREATERDPYRVKLSIVVRGDLGAVPTFEAITERGARAVVPGDTPVARATGAASSDTVLRDKLERLGDSPFVLDTLTNALPAGTTLPPSSLNRARRALVAALTKVSRVHVTTEVTHDTLRAAVRMPERAQPRGGLFVLCRSLLQAEAAVRAGADGVILDVLELTGTGAAVRALRARASTHITLAPPRVRKPGEDKIDRYLMSLEPDAVLVRGLGALYEGRHDSVERIGDFSLNVTNRWSAAAVLAQGLAAFTPAYDLDAAQLVALCETDVAPWAEIVVHHPMPLFHMEHCVIAALLSAGSDHRTCGRPCERHRISLRDRAGMEHPVEADVGCRNTVFHAASQSAAGVVARCRAAGVRRWRIELVRESPDEVERLVSTYRALLSGAIPSQDLWRILQREGAPKVVRGSLRVIHHPGG